ncbi:MAG: VCBS repeat-containing protein [bacterium]|nr:VCBS repeat-containing protein [bacterium]
MTSWFTISTVTASPKSLSPPPDSDAGGLSEAGTVTIWKGPLEEGRTAGFSTAGVVLSGPAARAHLGTAIVADWNGDGKSDLVLGAYGVSKCYVLLGPIQLNGSHRINDVDDVTLLAASGSRAGASLASGDVDADGIDDLLIVAPSLDITGGATSTPATSPWGVARRTRRSFSTRAFVSSG